MSTSVAAEPFQLTLRGFSPRELNRCAERACRKHFGDRGWRIEECRCVPCVCTLGGRALLYETRIVASAGTS
jgi:hypothetical protein